MHFYIVKILIVQFFVKSKIIKHRYYIQIEPNKMPSWKLSYKSTQYNKVNEVNVPRLGTDMKFIKKDLNALSNDHYSSLFEKVEPVCSTVWSEFAAVGSDAAEASSGSGSFITLNDSDLTQGLFLTCAHMVVRFVTGDTQYASSIYVENPLNNEWVRLTTNDIFVDGVGDIALIRTNIDFTNASVKPLKLAQTVAKTGDFCVIVGDPGNYDSDSMSYGIVRSGNYVQKQVIQQINECMFVDAATIGGNSGSPIMNTDGEVIGLLTFGFSGYSTLGGGPNLNSLKSSLSVLSQFRHNKEKKYLGLSWGSFYPWNIFALKSANPSLSTSTAGLKLYGVDVNSPFYGVLSVNDIVLSAKVYNAQDELIKTYDFGVSNELKSLGVLLYDYTATYVKITFIKSSNAQMNTDVTVALSKTYTNVSSTKDMFLRTGLSNKITL